MQTRLDMLVSEDSEDSGSPPEFVQALHDRSVEEGSEARLKAIVTGHPTPDITWTLDGDAIADGRDFRLIHEDGVVILVVREVFPEDEGEYLCKAANRHGVAYTSAYLSVKGTPPPHLFLPNRLIDNGSMQGRQASGRSPASRRR